jgi:hypothetical protein
MKNSCSLYSICCGMKASDRSKRQPNLPRAVSVSSVDDVADRTYSMLNVTLPENLENSSQNAVGLSSMFNKVRLLSYSWKGMKILEVLMPIRSCIALRCICNVNVSDYIDKTEKRKLTRNWAPYCVLMMREL